MRRQRQAIHRYEVAQERLEDRVVLSAGSLLWAPPTDFRPGNDDYFSDVTVQADGKIVAVGTSDRPAGDEDFLIARYTADGRLDASFGTGGWTVVGFGLGRNDDAMSVVIQNDGKILVGGTTNFDFGLVRLNRNGSIDTTFGTSGYVTLDLGANESLSEISLTSTGKIVAVGKYEDVGSSTFEGVAAQFLANGTLDTSFDADGVRSLATNLVSVAVDASDRLVVANLNGSVSRLDATGALDAGFGAGGTQTITFDVGNNVRLSEVTFDTTGRIVVVGQSLDGAFDVGGVARLLAADGAFDNSFDANGRVSIDVVTNASDTFLDVAALPNGGLVIVGLTADTTQYPHVIVLTEAGALDTAFGTDGKAFYQPGSNAYAGGLAVTQEGHYVIAGRLSPTASDAEPLIAAFAGRFAVLDDIAGITNGGGLWVAHSTGTSFQNRNFGTWASSASWKFIDTADFNGDGLLDVAGRDTTGRWSVYLNTGTSFVQSFSRVWNEAANWTDEHFADFNGDGRADIVARTSTGQWWVMQSNGTSFAGPSIWAGWSASAGWQDVFVTDLTGDGRADIAGRTSGGAWWVSFSSDMGPQTAHWGTWKELAGWRDIVSGDFDGDGRMDVAGRTSAGEWWVGLSTGTAFATTKWRTWNEAANWRDVIVGDFNGDGRDDIAGRTQSGQWWTAISSGSSFANALWGNWTESDGWRDVQVGDFNGDGRDDIAGRSTTGRWTIALSTGTNLDNQFWANWNELAGWKAISGEYSVA